MIGLMWIAVILALVIGTGASIVNSLSGFV
jgi:hypothetical protein